jgi:hypothetical protein
MKTFYFFNNLKTRIIHSIFYIVFKNNILPERVFAVVAVDQCLTRTASRPSCSTFGPEKDDAEERFETCPASAGSEK